MTKKTIKPKRMKGMVFSFHIESDDEALSSENGASSHDTSTKSARRANTDNTQGIRV